MQTGGAERVRCVVTLGTPHQGTHAARLVPHRLIRQLCPGSELMVELADPAPGCHTHFVVFYSDIDEMVIPPENAQLDHPDLHAENLLVHGVGHLALPVSRRVVHQIGAALAGLTTVR